MSDAANTPSGTGLDEAAAAFARHIADDSSGNDDPREAQPVDEAGEPEPADEAPELEADAASDEGAEEEVEGQSEGEEEQDEQPATRKWTVTVDGTPVEVDEQELLAGYTRQADYTRKTQAVAEQRKAVEAEIQSVRAEREQYAQMLPVLSQMLQQQMGQEPDWDRLYQEDPIEWVRQREVWKDRREQLQAVEAEQQRLSAVQQAEQRERMRAHLLQERDALLKAVPEWSDPQRATREKQELLDWMVRNGYSEQEAQRVTDHRAVRDMRKAMAYDRMLAARQAKPVQAAPKPALQPGAAQPPQTRKTSELTRAKQRLAQTGRWQDAVDVFKGLL